MRDGDSSRIRPSLQPRRQSAVSLLAWHVLLNCVAPIGRARGQQSPLQTKHVRNRLTYPVLRGRRIDTRPIVT